MATASRKLPPGVVREGGRYAWVKRVPKHLAGLVLGEAGQPVQQVRIRLHTDSLEVARAKAAQVAAAVAAEWAALASGNAGDARRHYLAARALAEARGVPYLPAAHLAEGDLADLVSRVLSLARASGALEPPEVAAAVLGLVPEALPDLREVAAEFFALTETRHAMKSPAQVRRWRARRLRAVEHFLAATVEAGPDGSRAAPPVNRIDRTQALRFRAWCAARVSEGQAVDTQNKDIGALSDMLETWADLTATPLENPFRGLRLEGRDTSGRAPFSAAQVKALVAPGALAGLNAEARDILLMLVNTGVRPSEVTGARPVDFILSHDVPHLAIREYRGRELKQAHTAREVPLLGVSLDAARRIVARGGLSRYDHRGDQFSAVVNKFLRANGLRPEAGQSVYSLRHYVEDALLSAGVDDRIRADILGQKYARPRYGRGGALEGRRAALALIAL